MKQNTYRKKSPGLVIAGLRGGSGKTIFSIGIISVLRKLGVSVAPFKKGPDYIDAGWLALAAGESCLNLDTFLIKRKIIISSFNAHSKVADVSIIEGNRGIYDCIDIKGKTSTGALAKLLRIPVILCVDVTKTTRTMAPIISGILAFDTDVNICGVIINRVSGIRHERIIIKSVEEYCGIPVLGSVPKLAHDFFLSRYEAPIPTSKICNAECLGCISLQKNSNITSSQNRINFKPSVEEIADLALVHIHHVKEGIISFGQGCEGDPLLESKTIIKAIKIIRKATSCGTININTNGSMPFELQKMFDVGLDSVRVSINSFRQQCYNTYFRPINYSFNDVLYGVKIAISKGRHVAINYLSCPGFTNSLNEIEALEKFLNVNKINMIQWRNLNFDPVQYLKIMNKISDNKSSINMTQLLRKIKIKYPEVHHGYYNLAKENF